MVKHGADEWDRDVCSFRELMFVYRDICPILKDPKALAAVTDLFEEHVRRTYPQVQLIVGKSAYKYACVARYKVQSSTTPDNPRRREKKDLYWIRS